MPPEIHPIQLLLKGHCKKGNALKSMQLESWMHFVACTSLKVYLNLGSKLTFGCESRCIPN